MKSLSYWTHKRKTIVALALAATSGVFLTLSFPKAQFTLLAWIALVPLFLSIRDLPVKESFRQGLFAGFIHYVTLLYWLVPTLNVYGYLPVYLSVSLLLLLSFYLALYMGVFTALLSRLARTPKQFILAAPVFFVTLEYVRSYFLSGFPWGILGYSQYQNLILIQFSDITSVLGVSFLLVFSNAVLFITALFLFRKNWRETPINKPIVIFSGGLFLFLLILSFGYGALRIRSIENQASLAPQVKMTAIQGNVDQSIKWDNAFQYSSTLKHLKLSRQAMTDHPDLIIWPETSAPFYFNHDMGLSNMTLRRVKETNTSFLIGCPSFKTVNETFHYFNSAIIVTPEGEIGDQYDKVHLVPYGEYVPLKKYMPFLGKIVAQAGDFIPGEKGVPLTWGDRLIAPQICFEIIFPELSREMVKNGADVIVNITNDAWFGKTSAPYQHLAMTVFRAIENRRSLVRAANTGISGFIAPTGKIMAQTALYQESTLTRSIPLLTTQTFYTYYAGFLTYIYLAIVTVLVIILASKKQDITPGQTI